MFEALYDRWHSDYVMGIEAPPKPGLLYFINTEKAIEMLYRHINGGSRIIVHCDVDMDGIGCGYILKRFITSLSQQKPSFVINKEKQHGIKEHQVPILNRSKPDLLIIVDSSSNEVDTFRKMDCDILVIDHHEINHSNFSGNTFDEQHEFVIVNNVVDNSNISNMHNWLFANDIKQNNGLATLTEYQADSRMSCGLVLYELLRVYCAVYNLPKLLDNLGLYQWAGVTLFTDAIPLLSDRNQWYIQSTVHNTYTEPTLLSLVTNINKFNHRLTKSIINYSLAPMINKAIRAGASSEALSIVLNNPSNIGNLAKYRENQEKAIEIGTDNVIEHSSFVTRDLTDTGVSPNYCGVIASKLVDEYGKNAIVYVVNNGVCQGSFRGRQGDVDYREQFEKAFDGNFAQGHKQAFGIKVSSDKLDLTMESLSTIERDFESKRYLTAGDLPDSEKGTYHIDDFNAFKRSGGLMMLSNGNSNVASDEQIVISVPSSLAALDGNTGKLFIYNVLGLKCKAFAQVTPGIINLYAETTDTCEVYIK